MNMSLSTPLKIRLLLTPLLLTSLLTPTLYTPLLTKFWTFLRSNALYRASIFETLWTVLCYAIIEPSITAIFLRHPEWRFSSSSGKKRGKPRGMRRPSHRKAEIFLYIAPLLAMDLTMIKKFADVELNNILLSGNYAASAYDFYSSSSVNSTTSQLFTPRKSFLLPTIHNFSTASPLQLTRALPEFAPSSRRLTLELIASFLIYDFLFFLFHLSLHCLPVLKHYHATHHAHDTQLNPQVTNQLSVFERLGLVLLANFSLNIIGAHVLTRTVFVPVFVWLLVELHCGMDVPWGYEKVLPKGWGGGARKHMRHHNKGDGGFEPFYCWWDGVWELISRGKTRVE